MVTRFPHIGDLHAGPGPRNADRYRALDQIIAECLTTIPKGELGAWLWPGDLNHGRMTIEDRNALATRLLAMGNAAPVVLCYGNHDLPGDLDVFAKLRTTYPILVVSAPQVVSLYLESGAHVSLFVLPYPTKAGLVALGIAKPDVIDAAADALDAICSNAAAQLEAKRDSGALTLLIGHVNVGGSITSSGQPNIGREIEISARHLDPFGAIYKGLNHIHKAQEIAGAWYAGSVCRLNWGEIEEKRYLVATYDDTIIELEPGDQWSVASHAIDVAPMYHVEGELTRAGFVPRDAHLLLHNWTGCEVRVRYTFAQSERGLLDPACIREAFAGALRLELEPIAVPDRQLRAPEVAAARTLPEKFTAYCAVSGVALTDALQAKLARLEHADPLALLSEVQTALATRENVEVAA